MQRVIVDPEDYWIIEKNHCWIKSNGYVAVKIDGKIISLHRLIMKAKDKQEIDHINRNKLDNRKENLRFSSRILNMRNFIYTPGLSGFLGVSKHGKRWVARIRKNGKRIHLGCFDFPRQAALAYQKAAGRIL